MSRLGIIAGAGGLPRQLVDACQLQGRDFYILGLERQTDPLLVKGLDHGWTRLGALAQGIDLLKSGGVDTLVLAGGVRRPSLPELKPDWRTMKVFMRLGGAAFGDDTLLKAVRDELQAEGFDFIGAHEILPELLTPARVLGRVQPQTQDDKDIDFAIHITKTLGVLDVGQSAVVQQGISLAVEAIEGTDALLQRVRGLKRKGGGGVLVKSCKPQQDKRFDLPTIGPKTVARAAEAGLSGIAVEAGASLIVEREKTIAAADACGLFIKGFVSE
jgi:DUF1009 family protein